MKTQTVHVESSEPFHWAYLQRSARSPQGNLHLILNWILEQLLLGNVEPDVDKRGDITSLSIGEAVKFPNCR